MATATISNPSCFGSCLSPTMRSIGAIAMIVLVATLASLNSLHSGLLLDDRDIVQRNPHFGSPGQWVRIFVPWERPARLATYRPVRELTFAADQAIWGESMVGRHLSSLAVYVGAVLMLWVVARRIGLAQSTAFVVTCWFALHAAHSETLCWLKNRGELVATLFGLGCLASCTGRDVMWTLVATVCLMVAMGSMESAAAFAGVALAGGVLAERDQRRARLRTGVILTIAAVTYAVMQKYVLSLNYGRHNAPTVGLVKNPAIMLELAGRYCYMLVMPHRLCMDVRAGLGLSTGQWGAVAVVSVVVLTVLRRGRRAYAWALFLLPLGLVSIILIFDRPVAEHRALFASAGLALCLGFAIQGRRPRRPPRAQLGLLLLGACVLGAFLVHRNFVWRETQVLWRDNVVKSPSLPKARMNFADACARQWLMRRTERNLTSAIRGHPRGHRCLNLCPAVEVLRDALSRVREIDRVRQGRATAGTEGRVSSQGPE